MPDISNKRFKKTYRRAYKNAIHDMLNMDEAKQVGSDNLTLTPKVLRKRITEAFTSIGVDEPSALKLSNKLYSRARRYYQVREERSIKSRLYDMIQKANPGASKEVIDKYFEAAYHIAMKPSKDVEVVHERSQLVADTLAMRKASRKKMVSANSHSRGKRRR